jgi:hypothetical protein
VSQLLLRVGSSMKQVAAIDHSELMHSSCNDAGLCSRTPYGGNILLEVTGGAARAACSATAQAHPAVAYTASQQVTANLWKRAPTLGY